MITVITKSLTIFSISKPKEYKRQKDHCGHQAFKSKLSLWSLTNQSFEFQKQKEQKALSRDANARGWLCCCPTPCPPMSRCSSVKRIYRCTIQRNGKEKHSTWDSNVVPHRSTNQARQCLTSLSRREAVLSLWYGRACD